MHQLCAALRMCGQEAWVSTGATGPLLGTPKLTAEIRQQHKEQGRVPIAVYPEVIGRNPLHCHVVTRYILNKPGLLGQKPHYKASDLLFMYEPELLREAESPWGVLHLPSIDTAVFHNRNNPHDLHRKGWCVYPGRHTQGIEEHPDLLSGCTIITRDWPSTREDMADLFRRSEGLYCFENTAISMEARLCGCPVVHLPSKLYDPSQFFGSGLGLAKGITFSTNPEDIAKARTELAGVSEGYAALEVEFWNKLDQWIQDTQVLAADVANTSPAPIVDDTPPDDQAYRGWYQLNAPSEPQAQHLASRMMLDWAGAPSVHLFMAVRPSELTGFEQTLRSLQTQVFGNWMLTATSTEPIPYCAQDLDRVQWLQSREDAHLNTILHEMAKASCASWISFLLPNITLDQLALQALVDAGEAHPSWDMIYCDDDVQSSDGRAYSPRFKPKPDLLTLCGCTLVDGLTLIRQPQYVADMETASENCSPAYLVALKLASRQNSNRIGHVNGIFAHFPECPPPQDNETERLAAERILATLTNGTAKVFHRGAGNLRLVAPLSPPNLPPVAIVVISGNTLEATMAHWRTLAYMMNSAGPNVCYIANRQLSAKDSELLRMAVNTEPNFPTTVVDLQGSSEGEALKDLSLLIEEGLVWILGDRLVPAHADALSQLLAWIDWPGTSSVQCGLWDTGTQSMKCPGFSPALALLNLPLMPEATGNSPTQQRTLASLSQGGMLLKTSHLREALQALTSVDRDAWWMALSKYLTQVVGQLIWKPEAICLECTPPQSANPQVGDVFIERHLPWLIEDGDYNPRLSLRRPALADPMRSVPWIDLPSSTPRWLLIQEEGHPFPQDYLAYLCATSQKTTASISLWTISASDAEWILFLEITRAKPDAIFFSQVSKNETLKRTLALMERYAPTISRTYCVMPPHSFSESSKMDWTLVQWLANQKNNLPYADKLLTNEVNVAKALSRYHNDIQIVDDSCVAIANGASHASTSSLTTSLA